MKGTNSDREMFRDRVKDALEGTQKQLEERAGIASGTLTRVFGGRRGLDADLLRSVADALGVEAQALVADTAFAELLTDAAEAPAEAAEAPAEAASTPAGAAAAEAPAEAVTAPEPPDAAPPAEAAPAEAPAEVVPIEQIYAYTTRYPLEGVATVEDAALQAAVAAALAEPGAAEPETAEPEAAEPEAAEPEAAEAEPAVAGDSSEEAAGVSDLDTQETVRMNAVSEDELPRDEDTEVLEEEEEFFDPDRTVTVQDPVQGEAPPPRGIGGRIRRFFSNIFGG